VSPVTVYLLSDTVYMSWVSTNPFIPNVRTTLLAKLLILTVCKPLNYYSLITGVVPNAGSVLYHIVLYHIMCHNMYLV